ncbi:MAG TPA: exonuclease SbcCD subunit D [Rectinemataceae bacterium]|nr:exonuclease SbcCD subunit D [Rectinemataceae bacterium]
MRFFHLSDLHLGKTLHGYDLLDDQAYVLERVVAKVGELRPEVLLIAGDIYDRAIPPVEAIQLFDAFLGAARRAAPGLRIVVVSGNHDSAGRLSFGASLLADSGLRIVTKAEGSPTLVAGEGSERVTVWALPFLTQSSADWEDLAVAEGGAGGLGKAVDGGNAGGGAVGRGVGGKGGVGSEPAGRLASITRIRPQQELMRLAIAPIRAAMDPGSANVLVAHCFASGAIAGDSELAFVGAAEQVDTGFFEGFDYVALGHLHSGQSPAPHVWYCGAPLAYSVGEAGAEKSFLSVEVLAGKTPRIEPISIAPKRQVRRLKGFFDELVANPLPEAERDDYIEVYLCDDEPVLNAGERLKALYPRLLGAPQRAFELRWGAAGNGDDALDALRRARGGSDAPDRLETAKGDFRAFHREMTGDGPSEAMIELFEAMAEEASDASD